MYYTIQGKQIAQNIDIANGDSRMLKEIEHMMKDKALITTMIGDHKIGASHSRMYDMNELEELIEEAGLTITDKKEFPRGDGCSRIALELKR
jgi:hypothetical protein